MNDTVNEYAPPAEDLSTAQSSSDNADRPVLASRWSRLAAAILDGIIVGIPVYFVNTLILAPALDVDPMQVDSITPTHISVLAYLFLANFVGMALFIAINYTTITKRAQSLGKLALGIQVVDSRSWRPASPKQYILMRYVITGVLYAIPWFTIGGLIALIDSLLIFRNEKNCLHDDIAGTRVVRYTGAGPQQPAHDERDDVG